MFEIVTNIQKDTRRIYTYAVVIEATNELVFIWHDLLTDIANLKTLSAFPSFDSGKTYRIIVLDKADSPAEARHNTAHWIDNICGRPARLPAYNRLSYSQQRSGGVRCIQTGAEFRNAADCARQMGLFPSALSNHLKHKPGYKTVKGWTFEYIIGTYPEPEFTNQQWPLDKVEVSDLQFTIKEKMND